MAGPLQYWMMTRPHRKLIRVPKSIAAFSSAALGKPWTGNRDAQIQFETELERNGLKRVGEHSERDRGRGGSGGRTHASLLYSLGLYFTWKNSPGAEEEVHLTLAGQALVDQEDALPILRRQVLVYQFPSAYSVGINLDERFRLRPFVLLLRLLRDPELGGHLTDPEIAAAVIPYAELHTPSEAKRIKERILRFRDNGIASLENGFPEKFGLTAGSRSLEDYVFKSDGKLGAIANTVVQWLRYTGYAQATPGEEFGRQEKTVTEINPNLLDEIDKAIDEWGSGSVDALQYLRGAEDPHTRHRAAAAFQRTFGRTPTRLKDTRTIGDLRQASEKSRITGLVSASMVHLFQTAPVLEVTNEVVEAVVNHSGLSEALVRKTMTELIRTPQEGLSQFLDRYQQMAFSGVEEALAFEQATANVMESVFGLRAKHVGSAGRVPDIEVHSENWTGIIDTKAYAAYDLPSDHQLRMQTSYVPKYQSKDSELAFFMYVAGGFAPSINGKLSKVIAATGVHGSGIGIMPLMRLINGYEASGADRGDLRRLWSIGREITAEDVRSVLSKEL